MLWSDLASIVSPCCVLELSLDRAGCSFACHCLLLPLNSMRDAPHPGVPEESRAQKVSSPLEPSVCLQILVSSLPDWLTNAGSVYRCLKGLFFGASQELDGLWLEPARK
jgi:hypothetical protein